MYSRLASTKFKSLHPARHGLQKTAATPESHILFVLSSALFTRKWYPHEYMLLNHCASRAGGLEESCTSSGSSIPCSSAYRMSASSQCEKAGRSSIPVGYGAAAHPFLRGCLLQNSVRSFLLSCHSASYRLQHVQDD